MNHSLKEAATMLHNMYCWVICQLFCSTLVSLLLSCYFLFLWVVRVLRSCQLNKRMNIFLKSAGKASSSYRSMLHPLLFLFNHDVVILKQRAWSSPPVQCGFKQHGLFSLSHCPPYLCFVHSSLWDLLSVSVSCWRTFGSRCFFAFFFAVVRVCEWLSTVSLKEVVGMAVGRIDLGQRAQKVVRTISIDFSID